MKFFLSTTTTNNGEHIVHKEVCDFLPTNSLRIDLGEYYSCEEALEEAKKKFKNSNGCFHCLVLCHDKNLKKELITTNKNSLPL